MTVIASKRSSPTKPARSPPSSAITAAAHTSRTTSATTKTPACATCRFRDFAPNQGWLEIVRLAHDLIVWTQRLLLTGELATAEPKRLRYRILPVAARLAFHARPATLRLQASWPWAPELAAAFTRLTTLPAPA